MKNLFISAALLLTALSSFAGTASSGKNEALGFTITMQVTGGDAVFVSNGTQDIDFEYLRDGGDKTYYREKTGKCVISIKYFNQEFKEGKTQNDYMLHVSGWIVQAEEGENNCKLETQFSGARSVTGVYQ